MAQNKFNTASAGKESERYELLLNDNGSIKCTLDHARQEFYVTLRHKTEGSEVHLFQDMLSKRKEYLEEKGFVPDTTIAAFTWLNAVNTRYQSSHKEEFGQRQRTRARHTRMLGGIS
jgi:hypothetical protein